GTKVFSFTRNETLYTIRLIPAGGYVRVAGEDPGIIELKPGHHIGVEFNEDNKVNKIIVNNKDKHPNARVIEVERVDLDHDLIIEGYALGDEDTKLTFHVDEKAFFIMDERETQIAPYDRQFASKTPAQRAMQLFAGPMMNFVLAIVIFIIIGIAQGTPVNEAKMGEIVDDSPAAEVGMVEGDEVTRINDTPISTWEEFTSIVRENPASELQLTFVREGQKEQVMVTPNEIE